MGAFALHTRPLSLLAGYILIQYVSFVKFRLIFCKLTHYARGAIITRQINREKEEDEMNIAVLISSLNPDRQLTEFVDGLVRAGFPKIIIVNDGSAPETEKYLKKCEKHEECVIISHEKNLGKGCALRTGMTYYTENLEGFDGIVTCDCDGQHSVDDTVKIARLMQYKDNALILGVRDFNHESVPKRCKYGNCITRKVISMLYKATITDTQTGLRGIPNRLIERFLKISGKRFEFEMNTLIECIKNDVEIIETPIDTIYIDENRNSHFRTVNDSVRIYWPMCGKLVKFLLSAFGCYCLELIVFTLLTKYVFKNFDASMTFLPQAISKVFSCTGNFIINKHTVFKTKGSVSDCLMRYVLTLIMLVVLSSTAMSMIMELMNIEMNNTSIMLVKVAVDFCCMIVNFTLQRKWVFTDKHLIS